MSYVVRDYGQIVREKSKYFDKANKFDRTSPTSDPHTQEEWYSQTIFRQNTYVENGRYTSFSTITENYHQAELIDYRQSDKRHQNFYS